MLSPADALSGILEVPTAIQLGGSRAKSTPRDVEDNDRERSKFLTKHAAGTHISNVPELPTARQVCDYDLEVEENALEFAMHHYTSEELIDTHYKIPIHGYKRMLISSCCGCPCSTRQRRRCNPFGSRKTGKLAVALGRRKAAYRSSPTETVGSHQNPDPAHHLKTRQPPPFVGSSRCAKGQRSSVQAVKLYPDRCSLRYCKEGARATLAALEYNVLTKRAQTAERKTGSEQGFPLPQDSAIQGSLDAYTQIQNCLRVRKHVKK